MRAIIPVLMAAALGACAHGEVHVFEGPDMTPVMAEAPSDKARLYADCIAEAVAANSYGRVHDEDAELVQFTCRGDAARRFYDGLAERSLLIGSEVESGQAVFRSTNVIHRNLFGADYCKLEGGRYECWVSLNAGPFLRP